MSGAIDPYGWLCPDCGKLAKEAGSTLKPDAEATRVELAGYFIVCQDGHRFEVPGFPVAIGEVDP